MSEPIFNLLILGLATWRISSLLVYEDGPYNLFPRLRGFVGIRYDQHSNIIADNVIAKIFACMWCMSIWVAIGLYVLSLVSPYLVSVSIPFAISTIAILVDQFMDAVE